jgi:hypothetical protein
MKRFFLSLCFVTFLSAGLVSCADEAADIAPQQEMNDVEATTDGGTDSEKPSRPGS